MKTFKFLPLFLSLLLLLGAMAVPAAALTGPELTAKAALVMDRRSGETIWSLAPEQRVAPADLTKLMCGLLAIEAAEAGKISLNDMVTVTEAIDIDVPEDGTRCGLQVNEQITLMALLQCALIASGDDAANMIADYVGGSVADFTAEMNERAAALGCTGTHFSNVHGAAAADHYTTPADFARIAMECTRHERLVRICGTVVAELAETNLSPARTLRNTNPLICDESVYGAAYVYEDAAGLKAGWNADAGYTVAATAGRDGVDLLCLVFGGNADVPGGSNTFGGAAALLDWVFDSYGYQEVLKSTENIASVDVALGQNATYVNLRPATSIIVLLPKDYNAEEFEKDIRVYALENGEPVKAPVTAGQVLGEVTLRRAGVDYGTVKLVASASVQLSRMQYIRQQVRETTRQRSFRTAVAVLAVLFLLYLIWVLVYRIKRLRHLYAVRAAERQRALTAEAAMRPAPEPKNPGIRFFDERGQTSAPAQLPQQPPKEDSETAAPEGGNVVPLFSAAPGTQPAAPKEDDLLAGAVMVAKLDAPPPLRAETAAEKAERDYFAEFFRQKR